MHSKKVIGIAALLLMLPLSASCGEKDYLEQQDKEYWSQFNYVPEDGYIKDDKTAIKVADAILVSVYGEAIIRNERPLVAVLHDGVWIVSGTLPAGYKGGTAEIRINKTTGEVVRLIHFK